MTGRHPRTGSPLAPDHHHPLMCHWEVWWLVADIAGLLTAIALALLAE